MIILTASEQARLTENKKKAEVNCSFEDVKVLIQSNEDLRNGNRFSSVSSYYMEQTDRQTVALSYKHAALEQMSLCNPAHPRLGRPGLLDGLHAIIPQMGQHSPQRCFTTARPKKCSSAQALSTWF